MGTSLPEVALFVGIVWTVLKMGNEGLDLIERFAAKRSSPARRARRSRPNRRERENAR